MTNSLLRNGLSLVAFATMSLLSLLLMLGFLGRMHPAFDSIAHFRLHIAAVMMAFAAVSLLTRFWKEGLLSIVFGAAAILAALGYSILPGLGPVAPSQLL